MKVVAWVPIKMNNERLPGKNVLPLAGKPLCQHVLGELLELEGVDGVYAFCSEEELEQYLPEGVERISRDTSLNSFTTKINDVILAFSKVVDADVYVYAQVTSPFLKKESIKQGLDAVVSGEYDSALSVKKLRDFLWKDKEKPFNYDPANIARTQDLEPFYQETGGFYIYTKELIQQHNRRTGYKPCLVEVSETEAVDIDYREDYELAQSMVLKDHGRENDQYNIRTLNRWLSFVQRGGNLNDYFDFYAYNTCAIYGAGILGRQLYDYLNPEIVEVKCFIDQSGKGYANVPCVYPEEISRLQNVDIIVITPGFDEKKIRLILEKVNCKIITLAELFSFVPRNPIIVKDEFKKRINGNFATNEKDWENAFFYFALLYNHLQSAQSKNVALSITREMRKYLVQKTLLLPQFDLVTTTKCSLKCKKCSHLIPYYAKDGRTPFDVDIESIKAGLMKLLSSVDYVMRVNILGGEPFLYGKLDELLMELSKCEKVGYFAIISNSTIVPADSTCKILQNKKFCVHLNAYGTSTEKVEEISEKLTQYNVLHWVARDRYWFDFNYGVKLNLSEAELEEHYQNCDYAACKVLMNGTLYACAFHKHGPDIGMIPDDEEALTLHDYSEEELREKIKEFYGKKYFAVCDYCSAPKRDWSERIPAAEQE